MCCCVGGWGEFHAEWNQSEGERQRQREDPIVSLIERHIKKTTNVQRQQQLRICV